MTKTLVRLFSDESGTTMIEYSVITGIITLATIAAIITLDARVIMLM